MNFKNLKEKCNYYRDLTDYRILPNSNILVMLDGKNFSTLVKNHFKKPFDDDFIDMMNKTAKFLCNNVQGVKFAYTQSDEISLLITDYDTQETDTPFGGRLCKLQSILASLATSEFNRQFILNKLSNKFVDSGDVDVTFAEVYDEINKMKLAQFDCKVWVVPNKNDVYAWFLYRQIDCIRNSKQQTAQTYLSPKDLMSRNTDEQVELCKAKSGVDWCAFADQYRFGRFVYKKETTESRLIPQSNAPITFTRSKFTVIPAFDLTLDENRERFMKEAFKF